MRPAETVMAVVLGRTSFGESDRILRILTKEKGKISVLAKGVRKSGSKLAGGIELFSEVQCGVVKGRGELYTLTTSRMVKHYGELIKDLRRAQLAYKILDIVDKRTAEEDGHMLFGLISHSLENLNAKSVGIDLVESWFLMRILQENGHGLDLETDIDGQKLEVNEHYQFSIEDMKFFRIKTGTFTEKHIKLLRLLSEHSLPLVAKVKGSEEYAENIKSLLNLLILANN